MLIVFSQDIIWCPSVVEPAWLWEFPEVRNRKGAESGLEEAGQKAVLGLVSPWHTPLTHFWRKFMLTNISNWEGRSCKNHPLYILGLAVRPMLAAKLPLFSPIEKIEADNWYTILFQ